MSGGVTDLVEQVMVAISQRDAAVAETEKRAGKALRELTEVAGLSLREAVEWCAVELRREESRGRLQDRVHPPQLTVLRLHLP